MYFGKMSYVDTCEMPTEERQWFIDRLSKQKEREKKEMDKSRK